jgi:hypothetical protein
MEIRDAVESDAERLAALTDTPRDVMRNLVHDRTVRVAAVDGDIEGFVSYDAREGVVHVTQLEGEAAVCERLLEEPVGFADRENMSVQMLVPETEDAARAAAEAAGFTEAGTGPRFEGTATIRFELDAPTRTP